MSDETEVLQSTNARVTPSWDTSLTNLYEQKMGQRKLTCNPFYQVIECTRAHFYPPRNSVVGVDFLRFYGFVLRRPTK